MTESWQLQVVMAANSADVVKALSAVKTAVADTQKSLLNIGPSTTNLATLAGNAFAKIGNKLGTLPLDDIKQAVAAFDQLSSAVSKSGEHIGQGIAKYKQIKTTLTPTTRKIGALFSNIGLGTSDKLKTVLSDKGYKSLVPMLTKERANLDQLAEHYKTLGASMSNSATKTGDSWGGKIANFSQQAQAYGYTMAANVLSFSSPLLGNLTGLIASGQSFLETFSSGLSVVTTMGKTASSMTSIFKGPLLNAVRAVWVLLAANPIGLVIMGIAAFAALIYSNWDAIVSYITEAWSRIKSVFDVGFFDGLIQLWLESWQALGNAVLGIIKTILPDFLMPDSLKNFKFSFATEHAAKQVPIEAAKEAAKQVPPNVVQQAVKQVPPNIANTSANAVIQPALTEPRPSLVGQNTIRASGQIQVDFKNAPQGMRVVQNKKIKSDVPLDMTVGYNSFAIGGP